VRLAEGKLSEARAECESLRRQLASAVAAGGGVEGSWQSRVADLEAALMEAQQQARACDVCRRVRRVLVMSCSCSGSRPLLTHYDIYAL
jgi:hypothetical protein